MNTNPFSSIATWYPLLSHLKIASPLAKTKRMPPPPDYGEFFPGHSIEFNKYDQTDYTSVTSIALCQTEGKRGCNPSLAYVVCHPE